MDSRIKFVNFIDFIGVFFSNWAYKVNKIEHVFREKNSKNPKVDKVEKIGLKVLVVHNSISTFFLWQITYNESIFHFRKPFPFYLS